MYRYEERYEAVDYSQLAQVHWRALVSMVNDLWVLQKLEYVRQLSYQLINQILF
jgi:hypothetical protein